MSWLMMPRRAPAAWVAENVELEERRLASYELGAVQDEWHRGKFYQPSDVVLRQVERERRAFAE